MADFAAYCADLVSRVKAAGWRVVAEKSIPYGRQFELADAASRTAMLNAYHGKKGFKYVPGGKDGAALADDLDGTSGAPVAAAVATDDPFNLGVPRIGGDESGKGDFFGPLVVAAFHLDAATAKQLVGSGITDSKKLSDSAILRLAGLLDQTGRGETLALMPREYNPEYSRIRNLNVLLARLHGRCVQALTKRLGPPKVVLIDEFARNGAELKSAVAAQAGTRLVTKTKGESDLAVAAASILARAAFVQGLRELEGEFGVSLPPGAGSPVLKAGRAFVRAFGKDQLAHVAKLHFKTASQLG